MSLSSIIEGSAAAAGGGGGSALDTWFEVASQGEITVDDRPVSTQQGGIDSGARIVDAPTGVAQVIPVLVEWTTVDDSSGNLDGADAARGYIQLTNGVGTPQSRLNKSRLVVVDGSRIINVIQLTIANGDEVQLTVDHPAAPGGSNTNRTRIKTSVGKAIALDFDPAAPP